ncbi:uncharacterized protein LOC141852451 [Brevipalpus obovatus]|uniref:uncharacterized protein LOC141852451 n=1 Tax=Brevipalpus obovatus TaxID=246614 RepID=UPI003D9F9579
MELSIKFLIFSAFIALCVTLSTSYKISDPLTTKKELIKNQLLEEKINESNGGSRGDVKPTSEEEDDDEAENPKRYEIRESKPNGSPETNSPDNDIGPASSTDVSVEANSMEISPSPPSFPLPPPPESPSPPPLLPPPPSPPPTTESIMTDLKPEMTGEPPINPRGCKSIIRNRIILIPRPEYIPFHKSLIIPISQPEINSPQAKQDDGDQIGESSISEPFPWPEPEWPAQPWPVSPWVHKKIIAPPLYVQKPPIVKYVKQPVYVSQPVKIVKVPVIHKKHTIQYHKKPPVIGSIDKGVVPTKFGGYGKYAGKGVQNGAEPEGGQSGAEQEGGEGGSEPQGGEEGTEPEGNEGGEEPASGQNDGSGALDSRSKEGNSVRSS